MTHETSSPAPGSGTPVDYFYVVSGCSGSGKSTLVEALGERGELVVTEPGRRVVKEQLQLGGDGLPWINPQRFVDLCAARAIQDFDRHVALLQTQISGGRAGADGRAPLQGFANSCRQGRQEFSQPSA